MSPAVAQDDIVSVSPQSDSSTPESSSSYSTLMNGFGLWSNDVVKKSGSEDGTANAEDEEMGEEYLYEEPVAATTEPVSVVENNNNKKKGGLLQKLKTRAARVKKEKKERHTEKLLNSTATKSCLPTLTLPRRSYPVQITVTEAGEHNEIEIDELDEEEIATETKKKAQWNRIKTLEWLTEQRIKDAMSRDDTESICSADGIPILPPPETDSNTTKKAKKQPVAGRPRDLTKIKPQFVQASKNKSALDAVRKEVDALMMEQAVGSASAAARDIPEAAPADESELQMEAPQTPKRAGWSPFSAKSQEEPKDEQTTPEKKDLEEAVAEPAAPATPEAQESPKKSSGWSMFSWKSKDKEQPEKDDCDEEYGYDDEDEESEEGSVGSASLDDDYTRAALSIASDDETRTTKVSVVGTVKE